MVLSVRQSSAASLPRSPGAKLIDNHGRPINYLRLAITDRCNLRCRYCMPAEGVVPIPHEELLSYEELERLVSLFVGLGIDKVRVTGGEPFARRGCLEFLRRLKENVGVRQLYLTTNGVAVAPHLAALKEMGLSGINLSLDTLDRERFKKITRRDRLSAVLDTFDKALHYGIALKVNSVITPQTTDEDIVELAELARRHPVCLRFIEQMPFSGRDDRTTPVTYNLQDRLERLFSGLTEYRSSSISTARQFNSAELKGSIGIIEGSSRRFCSSCNKIRITPQGILKACLYDEGVLDLKRLLREEKDDAFIVNAVKCCLDNRHADGHAAEKAHCSKKEPSMASIGG